MNLSEKLQQYFRENGVQRKWFAKKIGISPHFFYQVLYGTYNLPPVTWMAVIEITGGAIDIADLLEEEFKLIGCLSFIKTSNTHKCEVLIKNNSEKKQEIQNS